MIKKLCFILPSIFTEVKGGAEKQALLMAKELTQRSWKIDYIREKVTISTVGGIIGDMNLFHMPMRHTKLKWLNLFHLYRLMKRIKANYWYCRGTRSYLFPVWVVSKFIGGQVIWACSNPMQVSKSMKKTNEKQNFAYIIFFNIDKYLFLFALRRIRFVILQDSYQKKKLQQNWNVVGEVVNNSVFPMDHVLKRRENNIVWVGRLTPRKQPEKFLELVNQSRHLDLNFYMIGGRITHNALIESVKEVEKSNSRFYYFGEIENSDVLSILSRSLILVNTSLWEGAPNVFLEAWSCGVPVVTLKIDPGGYIEREGIGNVSKTVSVMIKDIENLVKNNNEWLEKSVNARAFIKREFNIKKNMDKFESILSLIYKDISK